jgi:putative ABC transport system permease protein
MVRVLLSRALDLVFRRRRDDRLSDEIQEHLDLLTEDYIAHGMAPGDARAAARRAFGGVEQMKETYRDQRGLPFVDALGQDLRFALRLLHRDRGFTVTATLVLGIGIGVNNMLFTILNAHTIRGLPIDDVDRVIYVSSFGDRAPNQGVSYPDFQDMRTAVEPLVDLAAFSSAPVNVSGDGQAAERLDGAYVTENAFGLLGISPVLGRGFSAEDHRPGAQTVALLGDAAWASRYRSDPAVVGRSVQLNGAPAVIVGIVPERAGFPSTARVWLPIAHLPDLVSQERDDRSLGVFGRLRDGVTVAEVREALESVAERLSRDHPDTNRNVRARVVPINERFLGRVTEPAWLAFMTVGFLVVLISCANVANLVLATSVQRAREIAIRTSLGASRRRVLRQLLTEGAILASIGGLAGLGLATAGVRIFESAIPENVLPYWMDYSIDARVLSALVAVSLGTVVVFGVLPAIRASKADVTGVLKEDGPAGTHGRATQRLSTAFLAAEFGLAVVMLAHLTLSLRDNSSGLPTDDAIVTTKVLAAEITLPQETFKSNEQRSAFYARLRERLGANLGVSSASLAGVAPGQGQIAEEEIEIEGRPAAPPESRPRVLTISVTPDYFETFGLTLIRGRDLSEKDGAPGQAHAIVSERLARQFFEGDDPIGRRVFLLPRTGGSEARRSFSIVGIAPDIRQRRSADPDAIVYVPLRMAAPATATLLVRSRTEGEDVVPFLRQEVHALDSNLPLYRIRTMAQAIRDTQWNGRLAARLIQTLTAIAVGLSIAGLYAVTVYGISQRTHEIGLRMALGARTPQVAGLIARRVAGQLAIGLLVGFLFTMLWDRTFPGPPGTGITDPRSLAIVVAVLVSLAAIACWAPIRRATRLEPLTAIRRAP